MMNLELVVDETKSETWRYFENKKIGDLMADGGPHTRTTRFILSISMMADGQRFHFNEMAKASGRLLRIGEQRIYIYKLHKCIYGR